MTNLGVCLCTEQPLYLYWVLCFLGVMNGISELKKTESFLRMDAVDGPGAFNFVDCIISFDTLGSVSAFSVV